MGYNINSVFSNNTNTIDPLVFVSDVSLTNKNIYETHKNYIDSNQTIQAVQYIKSQENITPITADLFNMIANRIIALETGISTMGNVGKTILCDSLPLDLNIYDENTTFLVTN